MLYVLNILFTSNQKFLSSVYLCPESQSNVGPSSLGPVFLGSLLSPKLHSLMVTAFA